MSEVVAVGRTYRPALFRISHACPAETIGDCQQKCLQWVQRPDEQHL